MNQLAQRKRELTVHKTIHPVVDALSYCARLVNERPLSASIQEMREQYPERRESINALFGPLEELERRLDTASSHLDASGYVSFFVCWETPLSGAAPTAPISPPPFSCPASSPTPFS